MLGAATNMWSGLHDFCRSLILVLLKVVHEQPAQLLDLTLEVRSTIPRLRWVEQLIRNVRAGLWYREAESLIGLVLDLRELTGVNGVKNGTGVLERATLAAGGSTRTDPAGVEEPSVGLVFLDLFREHACIAHWVEGQERLGEA